MIVTQFTCNQKFCREICKTQVFPALEISKRRPGYFTLPTAGSSCWHGGSAHSVRGPAPATA
ncbi:MAG: hypothetical protein GY844_29730 [Bradyrhizobium sp.]|nr:hypothetical protein [Bradyrhizobium sp.]